MFAPSAFGLNGRHYLETANDKTTIIVQIESRKAVENCEDIASVDGIGMQDLQARQLLLRHSQTCSSSVPMILPSPCGHFASDHQAIPEVQEATQRVPRACKAAGTYAGHFALSASAGKFQCGLYSIVS